MSLLLILAVGVIVVLVYKIITIFSFTESAVEIDEVRSRLFFFTCSFQNMVTKSVRVGV